MTSQITANLFSVLPETENVVSGANDYVSKSFANYMNFQSGTDNKVAFDSKYTDNISDKSKGFSEKDHIDLKNDTVKDRVKINEPISDNRNELKEKVVTTAEQVSDVIKEEFGLSDEELEEVLASLGLTALDLAIPSNIIEVIKAVSNTEDTASLLLDDSFEELLKTVDKIVKNFGEEVSVAEDIVAELNAENQNNIEDALFNAFSNKLDTAMNFIAAGDDFISGIENTLALDELELLEEFMTKPASSISVDASENKVSDTNLEDLLASSKIYENFSKTFENVDETALDYDSELDITDPFAFDPFMPKNFSLRGNNSFDSSTEGQDSFFNAFGMATDNSIAAEPSVEVPVFNETFTSMEDVSNLMDQVNAMARLYAAEDTTTIQMNLNPENLGRMLMTVTEHEGNVSARITVTNQDVKEILDVQLLELKASLESAGVRVQEVEVTVASHEFEENLDGFNRPMQGDSENNNQNNGSFEEENSDTGRRNINMNDLSSIAGVLTEEEQLVAEMMSISGNTVDFTA